MAGIVGLQRLEGDIPLPFSASITSPEKSAASLTVAHLKFL